MNATAGENTVGDLNLTLTQFKTNEERARDVVQFLNDVREFSEKQVGLKQGLINGGLYWFSMKKVAELPQETKFSFESDFLVPKILEIEPNIFITKDYFIDIGIPEDYKKASLEIEKKIKSRDII